jgi:hypothetical protein
VTTVAVIMMAHILGSGVKVSKKNYRADEDDDDSDGDGERF